jgi:hypothetical protein
VLYRYLLHVLSRSLSDFGESQLVPIAVIMPSGKTKPIVPPETPSKKGTPKKAAKDVQPKKGKGRAATKTAAQVNTPSGEPESVRVNRKVPVTRSRAAAKDTSSSHKVRKSKLDAAIEIFTVDQEEERSLETRKRQKATKSPKSKKEASPDSVPAPTSSFTVDIPVRKGNKRKLDEIHGDDSSTEVPPRKKRRATHVESEDEAPAPSRPSKKRKTSPAIADDDEDVHQPPYKRRRNAQVTVDEATSASAPQTKANVIPLVSFPHTQSFAETTTSLLSASQGPKRVFAKWGGNGMYYCGTLKKRGKRDVCTVEYDDGEIAEVSLGALRKCEVWVGDVVEIPSAKGKIRKSATVATVDEWEEHGRVRVSVAKGKGKSTAAFEEVDVESGDVSVPAAQVEGNVSWSRRKLSMEDLEVSIPVDEGDHEDGDQTYRDHAEETTQETLDPATSTKSRAKASSSIRRTTRTAVDSNKGVARSTRRTPKIKKKPSTAAVRSKIDQTSSLPFTGDAFLLALSLSDRFTQRTSDSKNRQQAKKRLQESITSQGGVCIEDWDDLLQLQGTVEDRRWIWEKSGDINYPRVQAGGGSTRKRSILDRVWVLADGPNRNTKYFTALALGVPCVGSRWVEDGVRQTGRSPAKVSADLSSQAKYPWSSYLLPAGHSSTLGQECPQIVNYDYADCSRTVKQLVDNPGSVRKPFAGKSLLFVSSSDTREEVRSILRCYFRNLLTLLIRFLKRTSTRSTQWQSLPA